MYEIIEILVVFSCAHLVSGEETEEYCISETFRPSCPSNEVIAIEEASFGRKRLGRCLENEGSEIKNELNMVDRKFIGCFSDVRGAVNPLCSLRQSCEVRVVELNAEVPCYKYLRYFLEVRYSCIRVVAENRQCTINVVNEKQHILISQHLLTSRSNCGTKDQPWAVQSLIGQRIKIGLINFPSGYTEGTGNMSHGVAITTDVGFHGQDKNDAIKIGQILDRDSKKNVASIVLLERNFNGKKAEDSSVFFSSSNNVDVFIDDLEKKERRKTLGFLLSLEATGCSDLIPPADAWLKRTENEVIIGCYSTRLRWQLKCQGQRWIGVIGNCSQVGGSMAISFDAAVERVQQVPENQVIAIFSIVVTGIVVCLLIACLGAVFLKRYYALRKSKTMKQTTVSSKADATTSLYNNKNIQGFSNGECYYDQSLKSLAFNGNFPVDKSTLLRQENAQYFELDQALVNKESSPQIV